MRYEKTNERSTHADGSREIRQTTNGSRARSYTKGGENGIRVNVLVHAHHIQQYVWEWYGMELYIEFVWCGKRSTRVLKEVGKSEWVSVGQNVFEYNAAMFEGGGKWWWARMVAWLVACSLACSVGAEAKAQMKMLKDESQNRSFFHLTLVDAVNVSCPLCTKLLQLLGTRKHTYVCYMYK